VTDHDADIIPIGTRGRPGRGTGNRPSAAARSLAPGKPSRKKAPEPDTSAEQQPAPLPPAEPDTPEAASSDPASSPLGSTTEQAEPAPVLSIGDRLTTGGLPVGDLLAAVTGASKEIFGDDWERRLAELLAFLRRRVSGDYEVDTYGFDAEVTEKLFLAAMRPLAEKWFRIEVRGVENIPTTGGALVVSNHSGTVPVDALMTMFTVHDRTDRFLRALGADLVFKMPFVGNVARRGGATLACAEDAERMLRDGELVGVWPEGFKGIGKPYSERYKLQRFGRGGFVSAALRIGVPIVPVSVVGAEEIYPLVGNIPPLARLLGVPYIPITPFFPLLGPLGLVPLPSKWILEFGEPIRTDTYDESAAEDPMLVFDVTDQVRETIQQSLYKLLMERKSVFG
jgi:1-acyl-sn-glycerol-3-phosphate acyltransferase